ncbi:transporter substrate-binding domain-containing protein [Variovorax sp. J22G73]|uniref:transporter substrate-binding domain-containing protein n=1 Tax=unclassified Variovorax TaxID=663243 RepID=UPI002575CFFC|nr:MULTISPECIES: transporter substrate-binding domain-containing protein [unclassified Variovorax]MDM0005691.1 transporter substrate-binding domain-containing protein [Variovorax sp. J22R203]MDM0099718.1 transporter substrate-binding domain-containing protein [Variovorax sp. J22G73]
MTPTPRRLSLGLLAALALLATSTSQAQTALDAITKSKTIKIAVPTDFLPYGSVGTDMTPQGLDVDVARLVAAKLGAKAELLPVTTANRIPYLQTRKADLVISTLGRNPEREKVIDFTVAYSPFFIAVFGPKAMAVKTPAELAGKSISVTRGSVDDAELTKVAPPSTELRRFEDNNATISAFVAGQVQLVATSAQVASTMMTKNPQLGSEFKFVLKDSPNFIGVAKGEDALRNKVNEILVEAKKNGELDKLSVKWLGRPAGDLPQ